MIPVLSVGTFTLLIHATHLNAKLDWNRLHSWHCIPSMPDIFCDLHANGKGLGVYSWARAPHTAWYIIHSIHVIHSHVLCLRPCRMDSTAVAYNSLQHLCVNDVVSTAYGVQKHLHANSSGKTAYHSQALASACAPFVSSTQQLTDSKHQTCLLSWV